MIFTLQISVDFFMYANRVFIVAFMANNLIIMVFILFL